MLLNIPCGVPGQEGLHRLVSTLLMGAPSTSDWLSQDLPGFSFGSPGSVLCLPKAKLDEEEGGWVLFSVQV